MYFDPLVLTRPLSTTSGADPDDVFSAKLAFSRLGYYEVPSYGLTPYPDQDLFDSIRDYQKDKDLTIYGYMLPGGETEQSVNISLARTGPEGENEGCVDPAIFPFPDFRRRRDYCPLPRESERETPEERDRRCMRQWENDNRECRRLGPLPHISGEARRQRCWSSANTRLSICLHHPDQELPELDKGEW